MHSLDHLNLPKFLSRDCRVSGSRVRSGFRNVKSLRPGGLLAAAGEAKEPAWGLCFARGRQEATALHRKYTEVN